MQKQKGAAILIVTVILLVSALLGMMYATTHGVFQQKTTTNQYGNNQAYEAAQAGLEFGLVYLVANSTTILASPSGGFINYGSTDTNITNITLANSSRYSIVYTNPTASNYSILTITSTGSNQDGTATEVIREQVTRSTSNISAANIIGSITVNGHGGNITGASAIHSGGSADPDAVSGGGSITSNDAALGGMTGAEFFMSIFGKSKATIQSQSTVYANEASVPWGSSLNGFVWVNGNVSLAGNTVAGSVANPVVLIVNGTYSSAGNATVNGLVYVTGDVDLRGNGTINGILFSESDLTFRGNGSLNYNTSIVNALLNNGSILGSYTQIPGSWKDF